ncbi:MAG: hypothetical protein WC539_01135 [Nitrospirota bacterium]
MKVPYDAHLMYLVFKLMERGIASEHIDRAMRNMVGEDWSEIRVSILYKRLQTKGLIYQDDMNFLLDDLEALIHGRNKLDDI